MRDMDSERQDGVSLNKLASERGSDDDQMIRSVAFHGKLRTRELGPEQRNSSFEQS